MKKLYILILIALSIGFGQESSEKKEAKHSFIFEPGQAGPEASH